MYMYRHPRRHRRIPTLEAPAASQTISRRLARFDDHAIDWWAVLRACVLSNSKRGRRSRSIALATAPISDQPITHPDPRASVRPCDHRRRLAAVRALCILAGGMAQKQSTEESLCEALLGTDPSEASEQQSKAPPFLLRLYQMVNDPSSDDVIYWNMKAKPIEGVPCGTPFTVVDNGRMEKELIPQFYKHSNFTSFIRQLNQYRFRKLDTKSWTFGHEFFVREQPELLVNIKRKRKPSVRRAEEKKASIAAIAAAAAAGDSTATHGAMQEICDRQNMLTAHVQSVGDMVAQVIEQQVRSHCNPLFI